MSISNVNCFNTSSDYECNFSTRDASRYHSVVSYISQITTRSDSMRVIRRLSVAGFKKIPCFWANIVMLSFVMSNIIGSTDAQILTGSSGSIILALKACKLLLLKSTIDSMKVDYPSLIKRGGIPIIDVESTLQSLLGRSRIVIGEDISDDVIEEMSRFESEYRRMLFHMSELSLPSPGDDNVDYLPSSYIRDVHVTLEDGKVAFGDCPGLSKFFISNSSKSKLSSLDTAVTTLVAVPDGFIFPSTSNLSTASTVLISVAALLIFASMFFLVMCYRRRNCNFEKYKCCKSNEKEIVGSVNLELIDLSSVGDSLSSQMLEQNVVKEIMISDITIEEV
ncbi:hypothetical protein [Candidatus Ichthyocystis sparus]|uniref:hypothetical protein n=1 Tax=Candidatus Ichthyocystis sparus TaxID=1561004 RepID=UPI000B8125B2|nr:hypothetical protein [Candidatus Ichthyocystis sparus]